MSTVKKPLDVKKKPATHVVGKALQVNEKDSAAGAAVKDVAAATISGAATGAATGGLVGAGIGAAKSGVIAAVKNKTSRAWIIGTIAVAVVFVTVVAPLGAVFLLTAAASNVTSNVKSDAQIHSSLSIQGTSSTDVDKALAQAVQTKLPWQLVFALNVKVGYDKWDASAILDELDKLDPQKEFRDVEAGAVLAPTASYAAFAFTGPNQVRQQKTVEVLTSSVQAAGISDVDSVISAMNLVIQAVKPVCDGGTCSASTFFPNVATVGGWANALVGTLSSPFGPRDCVGGQCGTHTGQDISAPILTPFYAIHDGVVVSTDPSTGGIIVFDEVNHLRYLYWHSERILVHVGENVKAGQNIGLVGSRGYSTGPHLHLEIQVNAVSGARPGTPIDPYSFMLSKNIVLGKS